MEKEVLTTAKDLLASAKPLIDPLIAVVLAPKIKIVAEFLHRKGIDKKTSTEAIEQSFRTYLVSAYQKFCTMNILVFPNQQIIIKDIYQPLSLISHKDRRVMKIDSFSSNYIEPYERMLISDTAGMGKSTLMKWIGASIIEQNISIPVLIELKRLSDKHSIVEEICLQLGDIFGEFDKEVILRLIVQGEFTFLLDGYDEVRHEFRSHVIEDIKNFISKSIKNWYIITSRPDSALTAFGDFQLFNINPLTPDESYELIRKYDSVNLNKIGDRLIKDIEERLPQVQEFLVNPFLVSLLYKTYTYNKDIPSKKTTFYEEVYGALYKHHDLSKDGFKRNKKSGLDFQDFRTVVNQLAFDTSKAGKVEFTEQELIKLLNEVRPKCTGVSFKSLDFAEDIELNVPLFSREGNILKWAHKSLQDFFAASYISSSPNKEKIITLIYQSERSAFLNIIDFLFEMEYKLVRNIIIYDIAKCFTDYCDSSFSGIEDVPLELVRRRQELSFDSFYFMLFTSDNPPFNQKNKKLLAQCTAKGFIEESSLLYSYTINSGEEEVALCLAGHSFKYSIMDIMYAKGTSIVKSLIESNKRVLAMKGPKRADLTNVLRKENKGSGGVIVVNSELNNFVNSPVLFEITTNLLVFDKLSVTGSGVGLDYDSCLQLIQDIEKDRLFEAKGDEFDGL